MKGLSKGYEGAQALIGKTLGSGVVRRVLVEDGGYGDGVGEQFADVPP